MRKLCLGLSFVAMAVFVACDGSGTNADGGLSINSSNSSSELDDGDDSKVEDDDFSSSSEEQSSSSEESSSSSKNVAFVDPSTVVSGTMNDERDGQTYKTVSIGEQTWMAENLNYRYLGPTADEDSSSFCYDGVPANCAKYGRLYLWSAAMDSAGIIKGNTANGCGYGSECALSGIIRGVCPQGWHLPSYIEWDELFTAVGGSDVADTKLKSVSGWKDDGNGDDVYSFSALSVGLRYINGIFTNEGYHAHFWSSTELLSDYAYDMFLASRLDNASLLNYKKVAGLSVRCLKD